MEERCKQKQMHAFGKREIPQCVTWFAGKLQTSTVSIGSICKGVLRSRWERIVYTFVSDLGALMRAQSFCCCWLHLLSLLQWIWICWLRVFFFRRRRRRRRRRQCCCCRHRHLYNFEFGKRPVGADFVWLSTKFFGLVCCNRCVCVCMLSTLSKLSCCNFNHTRM